MGYRNANYTAFYVKEPFSESNLGAYASPDFVYYNQLRAWKSEDSSFPFIDAHEKTYNVRDNSSWDTLVRRLHDRIDYSKNIILFLSGNTKNSDALREELNYGINRKGLPVIVVYPDFSEKTDIANQTGISDKIKSLWNKLPVFRDNMNKIPTIHIPYKKKLLVCALSDSDFYVQTMIKAGVYYYKI